jgi:hypothetical protein
MLNRKFSVTVATGAYSKLRKIIILHCVFQSKLISKCCNFSMNYDKVRGYSASVTSYPEIDLRPFLACHMSKIVLAMRGTTTLFTPPPPTEGAHPPSGSPLMYYFDRGPCRKVVTFLTTFLK